MDDARGPFSRCELRIVEPHASRDCQLPDRKSAVAVIPGRRLDHTDRRLSSSAAQQSRLNLFQLEQCGSACGQQLPSVYVVLLGDAGIITTALEVMR